MPVLATAFLSVLSRTFPIPVSATVATARACGLIGDHRRQGVEERIDPRLAPILNLALRGESLVHQRLDDRMSGGAGGSVRVSALISSSSRQLLGSPSKSSREKELNGAIPYCEARIASVETTSHDATVMSR